MKMLSIKKALFFLAPILFAILSCKKNAVVEDEKLDNLTKQKEVAKTSACCWIGTTNQANDKMEAYDPAVNPWTTPKWSWKPTTALGYNSSSELPLWGNSVDLKVRNNNRWGSGQVIVAHGGRLSTIAKYPGGQKIWATGFPEGAGIHGIEILPDGNCIVAAADGNYIRIYSSSQPSPNQFVNTIYPLTSAHQVLWDATHNCVWALGNVLRKYAYNDALSGGTISNPKLRLLNTYSLLTAWGHDMAPYDGDTNKLLVTTNGGVYVFNKSTGVFNAIPGAAQRTFVKAISTQPGANQMVQTKPDQGCTLNGWCTQKVEFYNLTTGALVATRSVSSAAFYRGKSFDPNYY